MLQKVLLLYGQVYLVLDALDECAETSVLTKVVKRLVEGNGDRVHLLVTSRNENCLRGLHGSFTDCIEINFENDDARSDLRVFIQDTITNDTELGSWSTDVQEEIRDALVAGADGMLVDDQS
jgi:hypothetical protein